MEKWVRALGYVTNGLCKFVVANALVLTIIIILPVFLITDNVGFINQMMDYLFAGKS
ncbi:MAG TPA: hypothetical protein VK142_06745 [Bacillota bacterium]|nr:hypothetical protein [Bacillota bacterium]